MQRSEKAVDLKHHGKNCCQSVLGAFADDSVLSSEILDRLGAGFGAGMGNMEGTCGALCGAQMVLGLTKFAGKPIIRDAAALQKGFTEKCGASLCKEIKGRETGVPLCSCDDCVRNAVILLEEFL